MDKKDYIVKQFFQVHAKKFKIGDIVTATIIEGKRGKQHCFIYHNGWYKINSSFLKEM